MWYVIQTITGKEKELVGSIERVLKGEGYRACFVIEQECVWRIEGSYKPYIKPMFPSYVFVDTDTPEEFFLSLKWVPKLSKLLRSEENFWSIREEERQLLCRMMDIPMIEPLISEMSYLVRRSLVQVNETGDICFAGGPLKEFTGQIVKKRLRKRFVVIEIPLLGEVRRIEMGIAVVGEDEECLSVEK